MHGGKNLEVCGGSDWDQGPEPDPKEKIAASGFMLSRPAADQFNTATNITSPPRF